MKKKQLRLHNVEPQHHSDSEDIPSKGKNSKLISNLSVMRKSKLGQSAPSLSGSFRDLTSSKRKITHRHQRQSLIVGPSLSRGNSTTSPLDSPKIGHVVRPFPSCPSARRGFSHLTADNGKDARRWSVASLPSSGYDTNSGSSNISSQCSSQEKLHHLPFIPTSDEIKILTEHFSNEDCGEKADKANKARPRSRSLSSSQQIFSALDTDIVQLNTLYKERFPNATAQMENKLKGFIANKDATLTDILNKCSGDASPIVRFVYHQLLEIARDCLKTLEDKLITRDYLYEITENLERLLVETGEKNADAATSLSPTVKKLLLIVSRPARLLECLEFDPEEFYNFLQEAEGQAKTNPGIKADIPRYIVNKLGLDRDPIKDIEGLCISNTTPTVAVEEFCAAPPSENDFETIKLISNGAYGSVYLVKHKESGKRFAMKKLFKNNIMLRNQMEQVFAERDIMSFADNPFVVTMYCSFETSKYLCLVMEYVEGGDCASLLKAIGPFPPDMAKFYFAETVLAVEYLHSYGIVHRDLKPDNLLITALGHIKLTDFGLSKMGLMSLATHLYEVCVDKDANQFSDQQVFGTPEYIAPEVILHQGYGKPVDWWAMGVILYEFLIGCVPFFGDTPEELFAHTVNDDIEWPDADDWVVEPDAKDMITALLQHNPRDRLGTGGTHEIREHPYFANLDWDSLLRKKAEFVPQLNDEDDTSYFDTRSERYNHDADTNESEEIDDLDESNMLGSFSSCSVHYRRFTSSCSNIASDSSLPSTPIHERVDAFSEHSFSSYDSSDSQESNAKGGGSESPLPPTAKSLLTTPEHARMSPHILRKKLFQPSGGVPRLSISTEDEPSPPKSNESSNASSETQKILKTLTFPDTPTSSRGYKHRGRSILKSASGLSLYIPSDRSNVPHSPGGSSTASSRDTSPCREISPIITKLNPPIIIKRGTTGYGFTIHTVRVYLGETNYYTMHHLVLAVQEGGPAFEAGLRPGDLVTHINGESVQGLFHTKVVQMLLSNKVQVSIRSTPLENTSIRTDGRKRNPSVCKLITAKKNNKGHKGIATAGKRDADTKRRNLKQVAKKPHHPTCGLKHVATAPSQLSSASCVTTPPSSLQSYSRSVSLQDASQSCPPGTSKQGADFFSFSSSSSSSNSPSATPSTYQRPSSLYGLKHKLVAVKGVHTPQSRRKSVGHIPLSPLARTPSPSPQPVVALPSRSPSPLVFPSVHHLGSSYTTQSYSPSASGSLPLVSTPTSSKRAFARSRHSEPGSPLLRRALSPDKGKVRSAEKCCISPLCEGDLKVIVHAPQITVTSKSPPCSSRSSAIFELTSANVRSIEEELEQSSDENVQGKELRELSITCGYKNNQESREDAVSSGDSLPRIMEEKDSPTGDHKNFTNPDTSYKS